MYKELMQEYEQIKDRWDGIEPELFLHPDELKGAEMGDYKFGYMGNLLSVNRDGRVAMTFNTELNSWVEIQDMLVVRGILVMFDWIVEE